MTEPMRDQPTADRADVQRAIRARFPRATEDEVAAALVRVDEAARTEGRHRTSSRGVVHHLDGNPYNNDPANLVVVNPKENTR